MKIKNLFFTAMLSISYLVTYAQTADNFRQPYPLGEKLSPNPNFTGEVWLAPLSEQKELNVPMANVTFEPGCRNSWHSHKAGQLLIATAGIGYYQEKGQPARRLFPGDIVEIAPDVVHWHGAAPDSWFAHIAITTNPQINAAVWLDPVNDEQYSKATSESENRYAEANNVLTGREQAIVAIASYTGKGDLEHLKPVLTEALEVGMTINEINEVLIHAYAYCGFPRSLRAIQTFMQVVDERKAKGMNDPVGREASAIKDNNSSYERGRDVLAEISGASIDAPKAGYAVFAPTIERFLKEHLFADLFERDLLTYRERELATVSILAGVGGVEPMAYGHMGICLHLGITAEQLSALLNIVEMNLGSTYSEPLREVLNQVTKKQ
ncbi:cupin domain-containing carboxymuconolactone decarboxylase family protein [Parabacteroides chinchillae]|uniref:Cupin domain protein n=1 Tax=Parabacteroides chinchillae TaxID=871327 RepID=A0A8G2BWZ1_9BACT|nr:carboxymuconolactone decarboxylase family protein [Parabacteroides chinchillae]SEF96368.1 Cupin domain protein [Parabacteroides chinchillae]